jgi:hypothetical protein
VGSNIQLLLVGPYQVYITPGAWLMTIELVVLFWFDMRLASISTSFLVVLR